MHMHVRTRTHTHTQSRILLLTKNFYLKIFDKLTLILFKMKAKVHLGSLPFPILYLEIERIFKAKSAKGLDTSEVCLLHQYKLKFT